MCDATKARKAVQPLSQGIVKPGFESSIIGQTHMRIGIAIIERPVSQHSAMRLIEIAYSGRQGWKIRISRGAMPASGGVLSYAINYMYSMQSESLCVMLCRETKALCFSLDIASVQVLET